LLLVVDEIRLGRRQRVLPEPFIPISILCVYKLNNFSGGTGHVTKLAPLGGVRPNVDSRLDVVRRSAEFKLW
jgi:hypothetical protein